LAKVTPRKFKSPSPTRSSPRGRFAALVAQRTAGIYAIVDAASVRDPVALTRALLRGGVRVVQYRAKAGVDRELVRRLHREALAVDGVLIVNDDLDAAREADGLHAGPEDLAVLGADLRARLGERVLGISCGTPEEVPDFRPLDADYYGVGPYARTATKADAGEPIGAAGIAAVVAVARATPVVAIGGIRREDFAAIARTGARMVAVASALSAGGDPEAAARDMTARWALDAEAVARD
jgi:thiamine-phosphate pyrophosphorylase